VSELVQRVDDDAAHRARVVDDQKAHVDILSGPLETVTAMQGRRVNPARTLDPDDGPGRATAAPGETGQISNRLNGRKV
jgi:hypothetical protein